MNEASKQKKGASIQLVHQTPYSCKVCMRHLQAARVYIEREPTLPAARLNFCVASSVYSGLLKKAFHLRRKR